MAVPLRVAAEAVESLWRRFPDVPPGRLALVVDEVASSHPEPEQLALEDLTTLCVARLSLTG